MSDLISKHGGYRKLKSFQVAQMVVDLVDLVDRVDEARIGPLGPHRPLCLQESTPNSPPMPHWFYLRWRVLSSTARSNRWRKILKTKAASPNACTVCGARNGGDSHDRYAHRDHPDWNGPTSLTAIITEACFLSQRRWNRRTVILPPV